MIIQRKQLPHEPELLLEQWFNAAVAAEIAQPEAMTLATVTEDGQPNARIVLAKSLHPLIFYTNYHSAKAQQLTANAKVTALFFWQPLFRQIRIVGTVHKTSIDDSDAYYASRPRDLQLSAWASPQQSQVIPNRETLMQRYDKAAQKFSKQPIPKPDYWGGYQLQPVYFEFWHGQANRLHDRFCYQLNQAGQWSLERLSP